MEQKEVTAVATQGRYNSSDWVSRYLLLHSDTGQAWKRYRQDDGVWRFVGNMNSEAAVQNKLSHSVKTRFLRFIPLDWNPSGWLGLRVEVYGCFYKSDVADFDGRSSLLYRFNQKSMSTMKDVISLRFKSRQAEGVLLHGEGQRGDYITLELHRGRLALYLNLGESPLFHNLTLQIQLLDLSSESDKICENNYGQNCDKAGVNAHRREQRQTHWHKTKGDADYLNTWG
uniref:F5/8 type C domain-containing protein n=1 Tax=Seriola lalandi dorsalis TaxID=1841481 RepID=A0A3B4Y5V5_SERLL